MQIVHTCKYISKNVLTFLMLFLLSVIWENKRDNMSRKRKGKTFTCDDDLWTLFGLECGSNRSRVLEDLIREYLGLTDDEDELQKQLDDLKSQEAALQLKLNKMKEMREQNDNNQDKLDEAMTKVEEIAKNKGYISEVTMQRIATMSSISFNKLKSEVRKMDIPIRKYDLKLDD